MKNLSKWCVILTVIVVVLAIRSKKYEHKNPELISTINSMNHEYCSVIVHKKHVKDKIELALFLLELCKENAFDNIKFATDVRGYPSEVWLKVYLTEKDFINGKQYMNVRYEMKLYRKDCNIRDNPQNYQLYIDGNLIEL